MLTSLQNPKVKEIVQLQKKRKIREEKNVFVVEGIRMFREVPKTRVEQIFATKKCVEQFQKEFSGYTNKIELVSEDVFDKISETKTPQGVLCIVKKNHVSLNQLLLQENKMFVVLENLQDPGNVGTIIRSGEACGVTGVILTKECADIYQAKTIRSTMGSIFRVPCVMINSMKELQELFLQEGICTYAADLEGKKYHYDVNHKKDIAFLIGNEGNGLEKETSTRADVKVKIPMAGEVESLNAGIAATLLMYEVYKSR